MAGQRSTAGIRRWRPKSIGVLTALLVIAVLSALATVEVWNLRGASLDTVASERDGVRYVRPLMRLLGEVVEAQSAAVRGGDVQTAPITSAVAAVDLIDHRIGGSLSAHERWTDIRKSVTGLITAKPVGIGAYDQYSDVVALVRELIRRVGESAKLTLDPDSDSSALLGVMLGDLPDAILNSGRATDLAVLAPAGDTVAQTRVAVARFAVAVDSESIGNEITQALDTTSSQTLGPNITGRLDAFRSAVDTFVPSGVRLRGLDNPDPGALGRNASVVRQAGRPLADAILDELDSLLSSRAHSLTLRRLRDATAPGVVPLIAIVLFGMLVPRRSEGVRDGGARRRAYDRQAVPGQSRARPDGAPGDGHDPRATEELLPAGRVATFPQEWGGNAR